MLEKFVEIAQFKGKKHFFVWDDKTETFVEITFSEMTALAKYSTCGEYEWRIDVKKSSLFERLDCFLEPKWQD